MHAEYLGAFHTAPWKWHCVIGLWFSIEEQTKIKLANCLKSLLQFCCLTYFLSATSAKSQWHQMNSVVFPPHPGQMCKPTGSQPNVFCMTASVHCSPHLTVTKHKAICWQRGTMGRAAQGTCMPERAEYVNATHGWTICRLLHDSDLTDSD